MDISFAPSLVQEAYATSLVATSDAYGAQDIIRVGVSLVVLVAGLCAVLFIIWGGVMLILSGGKDEKVKPAINSIRYAVIGIIVIVIAIFIAPKVGELLGLEVNSYLSPEKIFSTIKDLANKIFGGSDVSSFSPSSNSTELDFTDL